MPRKEKTHGSNKAGSRPQSAKPAAKNLDVLASQQAPPANVIQQARLDPRSLSPTNVLQLHGVVGNAAVGKLLSGVKPGTVIQAKLTVGLAQDVYEQEADRIAEQVGNAPTPASPLAQRASSGIAAGADFENRLGAARGGGTPLPDSTREFMEQRIGADFSRVKVHTDAQSNQLNQSIQAKAFTTGQDVFFRQGAYQPGSEEGQALIAHELTHTVQQGAAPVQRQGVPMDGDGGSQRQTASPRDASAEAVGPHPNQTGLPAPAQPNKPALTMTVQLKPEQWKLRPNIGKWFSDIDTDFPPRFFDDPAQVTSWEQVAKQVPKQVPQAQAVQSLDKDQLYIAVMKEFNAWGKQGDYPTGVNGQEPNQKCNRSFITTKTDFDAAVAKLTAQGPAGYHYRTALSRGESYEATDILLSLDARFQGPKMIFHIWGKYG